MTNNERQRTVIERDNEQPNPTIVERIVRFIETAGADSEKDTDRDGFLSYHAESHALGMGFAAGWYLTAQGKTELAGLVYGAAVYGKAHSDNGKRRAILKDIAEEPQYAVSGLVAGAIAGYAGDKIVDEALVTQIMDLLPVTLDLLPLVIPV